MKRYDSYKDSGTIWFNEVPKNWIVTKIKYFCYKVVNGATPSTNNPSYWDGDIPWIPSGMCHDCEIVEADKFITEEGYCNSSTKKIPANTTLVALTGATCSKTGYLLFESCTNQSIAALINRNGTFSKYFFYLLQSLRPQLLTYQTGGAQAGVNVGNCKNLIGLFPSYKEQKNICSYLDTKCGEVDKVISTQEKRISLLQELKQSIITNAVTKGLNPDVKMKDSGIEWIGEVPEHWVIMRVKDLLRLLTDYDANGSFADIAKNCNINNGNPYAWMVRATDLENNRIGIVDGNNYCDKKTYEYLSKSSLSENDILLAKRGDIGKSYLVPFCNDPMTLAPNTYLLLTDKKKVNNKCLFYYFQSYVGAEILRLLNKSTTLGALYKDDVKSINVPIAPLLEQQEIASYLDKRCAQIDASISKAQKEIELLQEYKQSLITEVVTGKRKVC